MSGPRLPSRLSRVLEGTGASRWLPWVVGGLLAAVSIAGLLAERAQARSDIKRVVANQVRLTQVRLEEGLAIRLEAVERLTQRTADGVLAGQGWQRDARRHLDDFPAFLGIYRLDSSFRPRDRVERGMSPSPADSLFEGLANVESEGGDTSVPGARVSVTTLDGRGILAVALPLDRGPDPGHIGVLADTRRLFDDILPDFSPQTYRIVISGPGGPIFVNGEGRVVRDRWAIAEGEVEVLGYTLDLEVGAEPGLIATGRSLLTRVTFLLGLLIALLGGGLTYISTHSAGAARTHREQHRALVETVPVGLFRTTPEGQVLDANPAILEVMGASDLQELRARPAPLVYVDPSDREEWIRLVEEEGGVEDFETEVMRLDGEPIWISLSVTPARDEEGRIVAYDGMVRDITARREAEEQQEHLKEQLLQAQKMEAVGRLAGGIAHDFNNLLTVITGNLEIARAEAGGEYPVSKRLDPVAKAAEQAAALTRKLLAFSRKDVAMPRMVDLSEVTRDMEEVLRRVIGEDIRLEIELSDDLPEVKTDPNQVQQVLMNLVVNARDAMPSGGTILVRTLPVRVGEEQSRMYHDAEPGRYACLEVQDSGMGMSKEVRDHLFEPFFTTKEDGTGLGLSMVYGIIQQFGGFVEVSSEEGEGTTILVCLPIAAEGEPGPAHEEGEGPGSEAEAGGGRILLVEDEEMVRELAAELLEDLGYEVTAFDAPKPALAWCREHPDAGFDLLLTDVVMPNMSGTELAHQIQALYPDLPVLLMSGYTGDAVARHGVKPQGLDLLTKPFSRDSLDREVRRALGETSGSVDDPS